MISEKEFEPSILLRMRIPKIRVVLEGLRCEDSIAELCRREGLNQNVYYRWSKEFLEAGKQRLAKLEKQRQEEEKQKEEDL